MIFFARSAAPSPSAYASGVQPNPAPAGLRRRASRTSTESEETLASVIKHNQQAVSAVEVRLFFSLPRVLQWPPRLVV